MDLGVIIMCQCRFILSNKCTIMVSDVDKGKGYACEEVEDIWEISVPSQLCYEPKTALKNKVFKKKR